MPVIPGTQEGQVLVAGSPVPIASPEEARLPGKAMASFGEAAFQLGDALDRVAVQQKAKRDYLEEARALQALRQKSLEQQAARQAAAPLDADATGYGQVKQFYDDMQDPINEIAGTIGDAETRRGFMAKAGDNVNDVARQVYANEVVKRAKHNEALEAQYVSGNGDLVRQNYKDLPTILAETELTIRKNPDIPGAVREEKVLQAKRQLIDEAFRGALDRASRKEGSYDEARLVIDGYSSGIMTTKEKDAAIDKIRATEFADANREYVSLQRDEKLAEKQRKTVEQNLLNKYSVALQKSGNNDVERAPILQQIELAKTAGQIDATKADNLTGAKVFKQVADDRYDGALMTKVFRDHDYAGAIKQLEQDRGEAVSFERYSDMVNRVNMMADRAKNDPIYNKQLTDGEKYIDAQIAPNIFDALKPLDQVALLKKVATQKNQLHKAVAANPQRNPFDAAVGIVDGRDASGTLFLRNRPTALFNSIESFDREAESIIRDALARKARGINTKELDKVDRKNLEILKIKKQQFIIKNPTAGTAEGSSAKGSTARGK